VNWRPASAEKREVPLFKDDGNPLSNDLSDGDEVEILSWRPKSRQGSLYQVRRVADDSQWWIAAIYLRRQAAAAEVVPSAVLR
jgi:hypothetical protein